MPRGVGGPLYAGLGNGGHEISHYTVELDDDVDSNRVSGHTRIEAVAIQDLLSFNLHLRALDVTEVSVQGRPAERVRDVFELTITPSTPIRAGTMFRARVACDGRPWNRIASDNENTLRDIVT